MLWYSVMVHIFVICISCSHWGKCRWKYILPYLSIVRSIWKHTDALTLWVSDLLYISTVLLFVTWFEIRFSFFLFQATELLKNYIPGSIENSAKMEVLFCILEESMALGDRVLVFSQSLFTLNLIEDFLQRSNLPGRQEKWARNWNYYRKLSTIRIRILCVSLLNFKPFFS
jgi:SNF2 family DNA or RNA helicase